MYLTTEQIFCSLAKVQAELNLCLIAQDHDENKEWPFSEAETEKLVDCYRLLVRATGGIKHG